MFKREATSPTTMRNQAFTTVTSILRSWGSLATLLLFLIAAVTNASAAATTTTTTLAVGLTTAPTAAITTAAYGVSVTLTATISPTAAAGAVSFLDGTSQVGTCTLSSGKCSIAMTTLTLGSKSLTASFTPTTAASFTASTSALKTLTVTQATTTTTLAVGLTTAPATAITTAIYGASVTLIATVAPAAATGTVNFMDGASQVGTCSLSSGSCNTAITSLALGSNSLTAVYIATTNYAASTSPAKIVTVTQATTATTLTAALASAPGTAVTTAPSGASVILTASVSPAAAAGTVTFNNGGVAMGTTIVSSGTATLVTTALTTAGVNSLTAVFNPTTVAANKPSTSNTVSFTVTKPAATINLAASTATPFYGSSVLLTASGLPATTAGENITFKDTATNTTLGTGLLNSSGVATFSTSTSSPLAYGPHTIMATFAADTTYATANATTPVTVGTTPTAVVLATSLPSPATWAVGGSAFTLTATVAPIAAAGSFTVSAGNVTFYDSGTLLGKVPVTASTGVATLLSSAFSNSTTTLAPGKHYYTASYGGVYISGTAEFASSVSPASGVAISGTPTLTITASAPSATIAYGSAVPTITPTYLISGGSPVSGDTTTTVASLTKAPTCTTTYTTIIAVGQTPAISCSGAKDANYTIAYANGTISVTPATPTFSKWYNRSAIYGTPITLAATSISGGAVAYSKISGPGTLIGATLTPTAVGTIVVGATVTAAGNYAAVTTPVQMTVTVNQAALTILASNRSTVPYGTAVPTITPLYAGFVNGDSASSLTTPPTCTTTYTTTSAAPGPYTTSCSGAVGANYLIGYQAGSIAVTKATLTISSSFVSNTIYGGTISLPEFASDGLTTVIWTETNGTGSATISGHTLTATGVGTATITGNAGSGSDNNYAAAATLTRTVSIYQAPLVITASSPSAIFYGAAVPAITASYGTGLVNGTALTTLPTCKTSYTVTSHPATFSTYCYGAADVKYSITYASGSFTVTKATPTISSSPSASVITYGAALSTSTLSGGAGSVPGAFAWTAGGTIPRVGSSQSVTFTPTDVTDYTTATGTVVMANMLKATPNITTPPNASAVPYNSALSVSKLSGGAVKQPVTLTVLPGIFTWTSGATTLTAMGANTMGVTFTPTDTIDFNNPNGTASVTVNKATAPVSVWPTACASINYGAKLSTCNLTGGTAGIDGTFAWTNVNAIPGVGTSVPQSVTFTPTVGTYYTTATGTVLVTVSKLTPTVTFTSLSATPITFGQPLSSSTLSGGSASVAGHFAWTNLATQPGAGTKAMGVTFTPTNTVLYAPQTGTANVIVSQAAPTVSLWPTSVAIAPPVVSGSQLSGLNLIDGVASVAGSFAWTDSTTPLVPGTASYSVTFTPTDSTDYATVIDSVNATSNPCGKQDGTNLSYSTGLNFYTAEDSLATSTFDAEGINESAICAVNSGTSDLWTVTVTYPFIASNAASNWPADSSSYGTNAAVLAYGTEAASGTGATITINDDGAGDPGSIGTANDNTNGVFASTGGTVNITDTIINTSGNSSHALDATYQGTLNITNVQATTTGSNSSVIAAGIGGGNVTVDGGSYASSGSRSSGIRAAGTGSSVAVSDGTAGTTILAQNASAVVVEGANSVTVTSDGNTLLMGVEGDDHGIFLYYNPLTGDATPGTSSFTMSGGSITYNCDATGTPACATGSASSDQNSPATLFSVANTTATIALTDVTVINNTQTSTNTYGTLLTAAALNSGTTGSNGGTVTFIAIGETLAGDVIVDSISTANLSLAADTSAVISSLTGTINGANSGGTVILTLDAASTWVVTGDSYLTSLNNALTDNSNITCANGVSCHVYVAGSPIVIGSN